MTQEYKNFVLIGVVEDTTVGIGPSSVVIATADSLEVIEELLKEYINQEEGVTVGFESYQGNVYVVSDVRIEWIQ